MNLSINPSYFCNFRCDFCYLTPEQLGDQKKIEPERLNQLLSEVEDPIDHIDLYGGEIGALKRSYYDQIIEVIRNWYTGPININTNFSKLDDRFFDDGVTLSVSYDFQAREKHELVFQNMMMSPKPISLLILASPRVITMDVDEMVQNLNLIKSIQSVEIKPYSTNQANTFTENQTFSGNVDINKLLTVDQDTSNQMVTSFEGLNGRVHIGRYGHIIQQNTGNSTTNFWATATRNSGNFDIAYGT